MYGYEPRTPTGSFLTWTTTPWTLPSNVALAVGPDFDYVRVRHGDEVLILAEARLGVLDPEVPTEVIGRLKGSELLGRRYAQMLPFCPVPAGKRAFEVVAGNFVTLDSGTGIVHMAPAFGGEDGFQVGLRESGLLPARGRQRPVRPGRALAGAARQADPKIVAHLRETGQLYRTETYARVPVPRPLRQPAHLLRDAELVHPHERHARTAGGGQRRRRLATAEVGAGRFGNWLAGNIDWSLSRNRFWGTPLNVWLCDDWGTRTCRSVARTDRTHRRRPGGPRSASAVRG